MAKENRLPDYGADVSIAARLYLEGRPVPEICDAIAKRRQIHGPISLAEYRRLMNMVRKEWLQSRLLDFDKAVAQQLAKIDLLEETNWEAWHRSMLEEETTTSSQEETPQGPKTKAGIKKVTRVGDAIYLQGIQWCVEQRSKLLGLNAPVRVRHETDEALKALSEEAARRYGMDPQELFAEAKRNQIDLLPRVRNLPALPPGKIGG